MLQNLRDHAQGWVAGLIVGILVLAFALWGVEYYIGGGGSLPVAAVVNGYKITVQEVNMVYERLMRQQALMVGRPVTLTPAQQQLLKQGVLQRLIKERALIQAVASKGFVIPSQLLDTAVVQIPVFQSNGQFSPTVFQQLLSVLMYTEEEFM